MARIAKSPLGSASRAATLAAFWCVHLRTAQKWLAEPGRAAAPPTPPLHALDDPHAMIAWVASLPSASQSKLTRTFRARIDAFRIALDRHQPLPTPDSPRGTPAAAPSLTSSALRPPSSTLDDSPDYQAFLDSRRTHALYPYGPADATGKTTTLAELQLQRDYALYQIGLGNRRRDPALVKDATDTLKRLHDAIYDEETLNARLGRELGESLPKPAALALARALPFWLLRCADQVIHTVTPPLADRSATGPLFPEEIRRLLEPALLSAVIFSPLRRALKSTSAAALPAFWVAELEAALADCLEDMPDLPEANHPEQGAAASKGTDPLLTSGPTADGPRAVEAPSVSEIPNTPTTSAISSDSNVGSGAAQTALKENQ